MCYLLAALIDFLEKPSGHQMFLTQTSSSWLSIISDVRVSEVKAVELVCRLLFAELLVPVAEKNVKKKKKPKHTASCRPSEQINQARTHKL